MTPGAPGADLEMLGPPVPGAQQPQPWRRGRENDPYPQPSFPTRIQLLGGWAGSEEGLIREKEKTQKNGEVWRGGCYSL